MRGVERRLQGVLAKPRGAALLVFVVACGVYANALANGFAYDDYHIVVNNEAIHSLETLPGALVAPYWPTDYGRELGLWRPTTTGALGLQYVLGGGEPVVFHAVNVLVHAVSSVLVLLLMLELMSAGAALVAGLVFAVHPVHVEAVSNVIGLSEMLATSALLAACLVHVRGPPVSGWRHALVVGTLYAVGFGAKESAVTLPGVIFLLDAVRAPIAASDLAGYLRDRWRVYLAMAVVAFGLLGVREAILGSIAHPLGPLGADLLYEIPRLWTVAEIWVHYVRLWVFPLDLAADYSPNVIPISTRWHLTNLLGVSMALAVLVVALLTWRRPSLSAGVSSAKAASFGVVWFVITISPISNVLFLSGVLLAERTLYLPSVGLAAASAWLLVRLARVRPVAARFLLIAALLLSVARTWTRTPAWKDNETMLMTLVEDYPHSARSQWILGDLALGRGLPGQALLSYRVAIDLSDSHYQVLTEIAKQLVAVGRYRAAEVLLRSAVDQDPGFPLAPGLLALLRAEHGDAPAAERYARASLALQADDPTRQHVLAWALAAQGRWSEAHAARLVADGQGTAGLWQERMYNAYERRRGGDLVGAIAEADSAWARVYTGPGRIALDSVRVTEFGLPSRLERPEEAGEAVNR